GRAAAGSGCGVRVGGHLHLHHGFGPAYGREYAAGTWQCPRTDQGPGRTHDSGDQKAAGLSGAGKEGSSGRKGGPGGGDWQGWNGGKSARGQRSVPAATVGARCGTAMAVQTLSF